ncbi:MAG: response regulator transcription factor [Pedobacter sp.]|nr:response regulator transcription factor [Pedobacter sp.]MDQ8052172.1 response regulator transcription factor [Pedobacter sp.]
MNILLAEDHAIVRNGVKMLLETQSDYKVVAETNNGAQVLDEINSGKAIDVVLTDINMPGMDGISLINEVKKIRPELKVVILSMHDNEKYIIEAFKEGVDGYLLKNVAPEELVFSLRIIHEGGRYLCAELSMKIVDKFIDQKSFQESSNVDSIDFSAREIEILQLMADGLTNSEMSEKLFISKRTIEGHRQSLLEKTEAKNTASLIRFAVLNGIVQ